MNSKYMISALSMALVLSVSAMAASKTKIDKIDGSEVITKSPHEFVVKNAKFAPFSNVSIDAVEALVIQDPTTNKLKLVKFEGPAFFQIDDRHGKAMDASYLSDSDTLEASSLELREPIKQSGKAMFLPSVTYTCSGGTIYANGTSTGLTSMCLNGSTELSCNGDRVRVRMNAPCG